MNVTRTCAVQGGPWEFNLRDLQRWCDLVMMSVGDGVIAAAAALAPGAGMGEGGARRIPVGDAEGKGAAGAEKADVAASSGAGAGAVGTCVHARNEA